MSYSNRDVSASSSRAPQQRETNSQDLQNIPVPKGTKDGPYLSGETTFEGKLLAFSYATDACRLEDERVQFRFDDGRIVEAESEGARALRIMAGGAWYPNAVFRVTLHGESSFKSR